MMMLIMRLYKLQNVITPEFTNRTIDSVGGVFPPLNLESVIQGRNAALPFPIPVMVLAAVDIG